MDIIKPDIEGLLVIKPKIFCDSRGYFFESYNELRFHEAGLNAKFVQDNESCSQRGTIRGLHFQEPPHSQGKLIRVVSGAVFDVAVDIRKNSPTYGKWYGIKLDSVDKLMFWIPQGFAHGFQCLEDNTVFQYKCTDVYHPETENAIAWNDPDIAISCFDIPPIISEKDSLSKSFKSFRSNFIL